MRPFWQENRDHEGTRRIASIQGHGCGYGLLHVFDWPVATCSTTVTDGRFRMHTGHGRSCCWLEPVADDPKATWAPCVFRA